MKKWFKKRKTSLNREKEDYIKAVMAKEDATEAERDVAKAMDATLASDKASRRTFWAATITAGLTFLGVIVTVASKLIIGAKSLKVEQLGGFFATSQGKNIFNK